MQINSKKNIAIYERENIRLTGAARALIRKLLKCNDHFQMQQIRKQVC